MPLRPSALCRSGSGSIRGCGCLSYQVLILCLAPIVLTLVYTAGSQGQDITPHERSPGVQLQVYDYFHPRQSGSFEVIVVPTNVWDQITPAAVAGNRHAGLLPVEPSQDRPDEYSAQIMRDLAKRHFLDVLIVGETGAGSQGLVNWFLQNGAESVEQIREDNLFKRSVDLAERELTDPRCVVFTTFNLLAAHPAALEGGPAFPLRDEVSLPLSYREYLETNKPYIQHIYLVDVAREISPSQAVYETYGNLMVPASIEEELGAFGIPVERITGEWEEDVSVAVARKMETIYAGAMADGGYEHLPFGWIPSSSLRSEWTNVGALIPFALAKQWFIMEYWADIHLQGREDTVEAFSDRYVDDFFLGMACLLPPPEKAEGARGRSGDPGNQGEPPEKPCRSVTAAQSSRREDVLCTLYRWLSGYLKRTGIRDFILCEGTGPYGENAAPIYDFEQVPGMILRWQLPDLLYRGWSGGGGLAGSDYNGSMAARKSCAVILLALERALYPPLPWQGEIDPAWPPPVIDHWEEAPRAICLTSDYEGWYANVFITPRLIEFAKRKGVKFTLRPQGDISFCLPDYLRRQFEEGRGYIEFSNQGFLHEFDLIPFAPYPHALLLADAVDRMSRFAGIRMRGFMPAGGFLSSPELLEPCIELGLQYALCPAGKYIPFLDMLFDSQNRTEAPETGTSLVSHFSERPGYLAHDATEEEDIQANIAALEGFFQQYDEPPYAPYTAWAFAHGFQIPDEGAFRVLEAVVDYLKENWLDTGEMVSVNLSDVAAYFEKGSDMFRSPVAREPTVVPVEEGKADEGGCGSCSVLPPGASRPVAVNYGFESILLLTVLSGFLTLQIFRHRGIYP